MAKLNKDLQKQTKENADSGFALIPDGAYHGRLRDVDTSRPDGPKGPYWVWEFELVDESVEIDGKEIRLAGRRLWNNTSLSEAAAFKLQETYDAFGVPLDTDTDEMIGKVVKLIVSQRTIEKGERKGEVANQISKLKPADEDVLERVKAESDSAAAAAEIF